MFQYTHNTICGQRKAAGDIVSGEDVKTTKEVVGSSSFRENDVLFFYGGGGDGGANGRYEI